jgi:hypothetical protein
MVSIGIGNKFKDVGIKTIEIYKLALNEKITRFS